MGNFGSTCLLSCDSSFLSCYHDKSLGGQCILSEVSWYLIYAGILLLVLFGCGCCGIRCCYLYCGYDNKPRIVEHYVPLEQLVVVHRTDISKGEERIN